MEVKNVMVGIPPETIRLTTGARASLIRIAQSIAPLSNELEVPISYVSGDLMAAAMIMFRRAIAHDPDSAIKALVAYMLGLKSNDSKEEFDKLVAAARESGALA